METLQQQQTTAEDREAKVKKLIDDLSQDQDILNTIESIEARFETTKDHYGDYMSFLSGFPGGARFIVASAMIKAGANVYGVKAAMSILGGA